MAKPGLLVDSGALIALPNRRETANQAVNRVLGDFEIYRTKTGKRLEILP